MKYTIYDIASIIGAPQPHALHTEESAVIEYLAIDSRRIVFPGATLFFAIKGPRRDGHSFIAELFARGVTHFVVQRGFDRGSFASAVFLEVDDVQVALQQLAAFHRGRFSIPVIGITGSNGKTIVKEWLYQLLHEDFNIVRSPRSYNSQLGVPLSVWQMNSQHTLAIFEAGISRAGEMERLERIIRPTVGVFTNIGEAHSEGFDSQEHKAREKQLLFQHAPVTVIPASLRPSLNDAFLGGHDIFSWGEPASATLCIQSIENRENETVITAGFRERTMSVTIPFTDRISCENAITCWCVLLHLGVPDEKIASRMLALEPVEMRMQLKQAVNQCYLLNDSYSNDLSSLELAIDYLKQQAGESKTTLILSDILQSGLPSGELYSRVAEQIAARSIDRVIAIGPELLAHRDLVEKLAAGTRFSFYVSADAFLHQSGTQHFRDEYILLKGARVFELERISAMLEQQVHRTVMEINLTAMVHNLKQYQNLLKPETRIMAMVKAFSYGSGSAEIARILQYHKVDYLAVAYADEGVDLRKAGISLPVMVMNADEAGFDALLNYGLEPEIYSPSMYRSFHNYLRQQGVTAFPVHIKFNTGMNRLGFEVQDATQLGRWIAEGGTMAVRSVFSHLVASESAEHDGFTAQQVSEFTHACDGLQQELGYRFIRHIANTAAIFREPGYQFDMVRLGIGLYGVDSSDGHGISLQPVARLTSTIAQIRTVKAGDTVGYGRKGKLTRDTRVATVRIGYADGYKREMGNGAGRMWLRGSLAPVIGNVCMDMTMIDVTDIPGAAEGDTVEVFGPALPVWQLAAWAGTISYELMTNVSQRVKRVYWEE